MTEFDADAVLSSADPEPPAGTVVRDDCGMLWENDGSQYRPACWVRPDLVEQGIHDPESWTKVAGNYGPVTIVYGTPDPDAAIEQMADFQVRLQQMQDAVIGTFDPGHQFTGLFGGDQS